MNRAELISVRDLSKSVDAAVKHALDRVKLKPDGHNIIVRWDIIGRILNDLKLADEFAKATTEAMRQAGHAHVEPAVISINGHITAGFVENINMPVRNI